MAYGDQKVSSSNSCPSSKTRQCLAGARAGMTKIMCRSLHNVLGWIKNGERTVAMYSINTFLNS